MCSSSSSFVEQAMWKIKIKKTENSNPGPGRHCELLILKLNCVFCLHEHCCAACLSKREEICKQESIPILDWLFGSSGNGECMEKVFQNFGHQLCAEFVFECSEDSEVKEIDQAKEDDSIHSGQSKESSGNKDAVPTNISAAVKAAMAPHLLEFTTKEDIAGLATKNDLEKAVSDVRRLAVLDSSRQVASLSASVEELKEKATAKVTEVGDLAVSKIQALTANEPSASNKKRKLEDQQLPPKPLAPESGEKHVRMSREVANLDSDQKQHQNMTI